LLLLLNLADGVPNGRVRFRSKSTMPSEKSPPGAWEGGEWGTKDTSINNGSKRTDRSALQFEREAAARTLLLLARYGKQEKPGRRVPKISQETLAEMVGTTRLRVNCFMKKFQRLGFIDYKDGLKVHNALVTIVLHD
jgi:hypothetical protein